MTSCCIVIAAFRLWRLGDAKVLGCLFEHRTPQLMEFHTSGLYTYYAVNYITCNVLCLARQIRLNSVSCNCTSAHLCTVLCTVHTAHSRHVRLCSAPCRLYHVRPVSERCGLVDRREGSWTDRPSAQGRPPALTAGGRPPRRPLLLASRVTLAAEPPLEWEKS